jgi:O-antigen/teichoic acid export membrane protein
MMKTNKAGPGVIYLTLSSIAFMLSGYITSIWLGRRLGPALFGLYGIVTTLMTFINVVQASSIPQATIKYTSEDPDKSEQILKIAIRLVLATNIVLSILLLTTANNIAELLGDKEIAPYLRLLALVFPLYGLFVLFSAYNNGLHRFAKQTKITITYSMAKLFFVILLSYFYLLNGAIIGFILAPLIAVLSDFYWPKTKEWFPPKKLLTSSLPLMLFAAISTLQISIDLFFVKALTHYSHAAGYFTVSQNISRIPFYALSAFSLVLYPSVSARLGKGEIDRAKNITNTALRYLLIILVPVTALIAGTSKQLILLFYGEAYTPASNSLSVLVFGYALLTVFILLANALNGSNKASQSWIYAGIGTALAIISYIFLIPHLGLTGASLGTSIGALLSTSLAFYSVRKRLKVTLSPISLLRIILAALIIFALTQMIHLYGLLLLLSYALLIVLYIGILVILKEFSIHDYKQLMELMPKKIRILGNIKQ